jgi:hypothetical protein
LKLFVKDLIFLDVMRFLNDLWQLEHHHLSCISNTIISRAFAHFLMYRIFSNTIISRAFVQLGSKVTRDGRSLNDIVAMRTTSSPVNMLRCRRSFTDIMATNFLMYFQNQLLSCISVVNTFMTSNSNLIDGIFS